MGNNHESDESEDEAGEKPVTVILKPVKRYYFLIALK